VPDITVDTCQQPTFQTLAHLEIAADQKQIARGVDLEVRVLFK
jgi:hypothetical protein